MRDKPTKLLVLTPETKPRVVDLTGEPLRIGRSKKNEIFLDDLLVSRQHAIFFWEKGELWLGDLNSVNGTQLNEKRLGGNSRVHVGDRVQIGQTLLKVEGSLGDQPAEADRERSVELLPETTLKKPDDSQTSTDLYSLIASVRDSGRIKEAASPADRIRKRLEAIHQVGRALLSPHTLDEVLRDIVYLVLDVIPAERASLFMKNPADGQLACKVACYRHGDATADIEPIAISRAVVEEVIGRGQPLLACDTQSDSRFQQRQSIIRSGVLSIMAVPVILEGSPVGMLYVDSRRSKACFNEADLELLTTVASVVDIKIENALLLEERLENTRMHQQLENARQIQLRLLPSETVSIEGYDLVGLTIPCFAVGGDYYDFIPLADGRMAIVLADVVGKGMEAALLVSCLHACMRSQARSGAPLAEKVATISRYLFENTSEAKFATLFYAELDPAYHNLAWVNAGHNPPLLMRADGRVQALSSGGFPVGMMAEAQYATGNERLEAGDLLLVYSDGVTDASASGDEEFGIGRLEAATRENRRSPMSRLLEQIVQLLHSFLKGGRAKDDITLAALKRLA